MTADTPNAHEVVLRMQTTAVSELPALLLRYEQDPRSSVQAALRAAKRRLLDYEAELNRTHALYDAQERICKGGLAVGLDEVGRGAVAGPLTVAAVALPSEPIILGINDSKQLTPARREALAREIKASALGIGIAHIQPEIIDAKGIALALKQAMLEALEATGLNPEYVLIDGNPLHIHPREICIVKGDAKIAAIAAASIVAKVTRDALMVLADDDYPGYCFAQSKGYASAEHIAAIRDKGLTDYHRASFCTNFVHEQLSLL